MKQSIKILLLGLLAMGTLSGCDFSLPSNSSSNGSSGSSVSESGSSSSSGSSSKSSESSSQGESSSSGESSSEDYSSEDSSESESQSEQSSGSEESSSSSSSEDVPPEPKTDWTDEEKILMRDYLHGIVLPFLEVEGAALDFDEDLEKFSIEQLAIEDGDIATYAAKFAAADGWNDVSNQYSTYSSAPAGSFYVFERFVATDEGRRGISVQFFGHDGTSYSTAGPMYLFASDPFMYEFPDLEEEYGYYEVENGTPVIAPESSDLYFEFVPSSYNDIYYEYGYPEYLNASIYIYGLDQESFGDYLELYEANDWVVTPDPDYVDSYSATLLDEDVNLQYSVGIYFSVDYVALSFNYLGELPANAWPASDISAAFESAGLEEFYVPPFEGEGFEYEFKDYSAYGVAAIYVSGCTADELAGYAEDLYDEGWDYVVNEGVYTATIMLEDGIAKVEFAYDSTNEKALIYIYLALDDLPSAEWPLEDITNAFGEDVAAELPAFAVEGFKDATFKVYNDGFGMGITVFTGGDEEDAATALEDYAAILLAEEFKYDEESHLFTAPSEAFFVELYVGTDGAFNIEIIFPKTMSALDLETLADMFDEIGWDLELPAFEIESKTGFSYLTADPTDPDDYFMIYAYVDSSSIAKQAISDYEDILLENDFTPDGTNRYGEPLLLDPTGTYQIELTYDYDDESNVYFAINIRLATEPELTPVDADEVAVMFEDSEWEGFEFPEFEMYDAEIYYFSADPSDPSDYCQVGCYFNSIDDAEDAFDNLVAALNASEDFEYVGPLDSGATGDAEFTIAGYDIQILYGYSSYGPAMFINIYLAE